MWIVVRKLHVTEISRHVNHADDDANIVTCHVCSLLHRIQQISHQHIRLPIGTKVLVVCHVQSRVTALFAVQ